MSEHGPTSGNGPPRVPAPRRPAVETARIAAAVRELLAQGVAVTPAVQRFIDATFLNPSAAELQALLDEESAEAGGPLLELLFSPDETQQAAVEPFLPDRALSPAEEALVAQALCRPPLAPVFHLPPPGGRLSAETSPALARRFVAGLRMGRPVPEDIAQTIRTVIGRADGMRWRVAVRNSRVNWSPDTSAALCAFIRRAGNPTGDDLQCLEFALEVMAEIDAGGDIVTAFAGSKRRLAKALERSRRQTELLARSNIETLASCGVRLVGIDEAETRRRMAWIDRFTLAVFGRVEPLDAAEGEGVAVALDPAAAADLWRTLGGDDLDSV